VGKESQEIIADAATGELLPFSIRLIRNTAVQWCILLSLHYLMQKIVIFPECVENCFLRTTEQCCPFHYLFLMEMIVLLSGLFVGSCIITKLTPRKKFQQSASTTAITVLTITTFTSVTHFPLPVICGIALLSFFVMFAGYKFSFRLRGR